MTTLIPIQMPSEMKVMWYLEGSGCGDAGLPRKFRGQKLSSAIISIWEE